MLWDIEPEKKLNRRNVWISLSLAGLIMLFIFTIFPLMKVLVTSPQMPQALREVIVDIVKAKEKERVPEKEEEKTEEEAPKRRATPEERRNEPRQREQMTHERMQQQEVALQQEIDLNLQRQRSQQRDLRRDRDTEGRRETDRASTSEIIVPRGDASVQIGGGSRASLGRDRGDVRGRTERTSSGRASLEMGAGPAVPTLEDEAANSKNIENNVSPIIDWMRQNQREIPRDLKEPEYFNFQASDLTTWVQYTAPDGEKYTIYMLGREGSPPELKIFLVHGNEGVLLTDIGAKGARSESFQAGHVLVRGDRMSLQMSQISPGDPRANDSMDIFVDWWNSSSN